MILSELLKYNDIVVQCHDFPDADTIASGFAVYLYLKAYGKSPRLIYSGKQLISKPNLLLMIEKLEIPLEYVTELKKPAALVTCDCFYGEGNVTKFEAENVYIIDHHLCENADRSHAEIRSSYGSCSSVAASMLNAEGFDYNSNINLATALFYGLYTDTNGLNEVRHPDDRNLRDLTQYDETLVNILKNSNLSLEEMKIAGDALKHYKYNDVYEFAVVEAMPCDPNILGFISDLLLQVDKVETCVVYCNIPNGTKLSVRSCTNDVRANEMIQFITADVGSGGGHAQKAGGYIGRTLETTDTRQFITNRIIEYYNSYDIIYAEKYDIDLNLMKKYIKQPVTVGYVRSTDILPAGEEICVRTLEADLNVRTDDELYIMVGVRGEVYPINKQKFYVTYRDCDDEFNMRTAYAPSIYLKNECRNIDLKPYIRACVSGGSAPIYAMPLKRGMKVFTEWDKDNYMLGEKGDYLAARTDNLHDLYIIEQSIFCETYKPY